MHVKSTPTTPAPAAAPRPSGALTSPARRRLMPGGIKGVGRAAQIVLAKPTVRRKQPPVTLDLSEYAAPGYVYDTNSLARIQRLMQALPADARGMRWIHEGESVLFYVEHDLEIPYDEFVSRVDIAHVGLLFRDVLGITTDVLARDEQGRSTLQMERIAALAQPNYTAFMGKDELDVYKLERLDYGPDEQRNWMRTVHSPNGSAVCDDGYLAFGRHDGGRRTQIRFLACQQFPIPPVMALLRMDRWRWLRRVLTQSAYRRFYGQTMDNLQAVYEGRDHRVGRSPRHE